MDKASVLKVIDRFRTVVENKKIKIDKIILFGSYSKGNFNEGSDIDIVLISDDFASMGYWERIDFLTDAIYEVYEPIEAFLFTPGEWEKNDSFLVDYAREGEIVFAA